nr:MAG TPA: hypothetical protein [Caudoviricetes sp.]
MPMTQPKVGCWVGVIKHPAAPCPARYKHARNAGWLPRPQRGAMRVNRSPHGVLFGRNWGPSPAYVPGCAARPCARLRPLTYATARLRYEATLHSEP